MNNNPNNPVWRVAPSPGTAMIEPTAALIASYYEALVNIGMQPELVNAIVLDFAGKWHIGLVTKAMSVATDVHDDKISKAGL